jgi:hypothetical protein
VRRIGLLREFEAGIDDRFVIPDLLNAVEQVSS